MAIVLGDWEVTRSNGNIRYIGGDHGVSPTYATVIEFHRWLQGLADDASAVGDDQVDMTDLDPSARSTDNIIRLLGLYNIDATTAEHLYDGSIIQGSGGTEEYYDGIVNFGNSTVVIQLHQNGAVIADDWWNSNGGLNANATQGISHRFMIKTRTAGADIDGRRILGTSRSFGNTYSEFSINGTARGNNVLALSDANDLNNETAEGTVSGWTGIALTTEGYSLIDVDNEGTDEFYYGEWNTNQPTRSINDFFERMKWLTRDGSAATLYGLNGELFRGITHEFVVDTPLVGDLNAFEEVTWGAGETAGVAQMLAVNSVSNATRMWVQLLSGVIPTDGETITGTTSGGTVDINATVTPRILSTPFVGASTGSALIGAYGLGVEKLDLTNSDKLLDLDAATITPPNNVVFTVAGLASAEDYVIVAPWDGTSVDLEGFPAVNKTQNTIKAANSLTTGAVTAVVLTLAIPTDTPASGTIRIGMDDGRDRYVAYTEYTGDTFTIASTSFTSDEATAGNGVWISYIDEIASGQSHTADYDNEATGPFVQGEVLTFGAGGTATLLILDDQGATGNLIFEMLTGAPPLDDETISGAGGATADTVLDATSLTTTLTFTGVFLSSRDLVVIVRDGKNSPIKQFISSATLGSNGGSITAIRTSDA
jgi:hypothetical protein